MQTKSYRPLLVLFIQAYYFQIIFVSCIDLKIKDRGVQITNLSAK